MESRSTTIPLSEQIFLDEREVTSRGESTKKLANPDSLSL